MFTPETTAFLEGGCSLIVGTVSRDGEPTATRGWGATVLSRDGEIRLVLATSAERTREDLEATGAIAVTGADVRTLHSLQLKGTVFALEAATDADRERAMQYADAFFDDIARTDGTERSLLERMRPTEFFVCMIRANELYDQTPGPGAGVAISAGAS